MADKDNTRSETDATYAADNSTYDANTGKLKKLGPDTAKLKDLADVASKANLQSTAGKGLGSLGTQGGPKQLPGEDISTFAARRRKWQEEQAAGQKKAFEPATK